MTEQTLVEWAEHPYTSIKRRGATVEHRVVLFTYDHGFDLEHQVRGDADANPPAEWTPVDVWEIRNGRVRKLNRNRVLRE